MSPLDGLVRLFGGDPAVFRPVARAQALIVARRARLVQTKRGLLAGLSPFRILCLFAGLNGLMGAFFVSAAPSRILGAGLALTLGCFFLLMVVMMDDMDVLVNPREYLVLAAHPHDDRSFLLAKIFVVGRSLAILSVALFVPPALGIAVAAKSAVAGLLDLVGAAGAALAGSIGAMFLGAAVLSFGGRRAMDRLLPWFQVIFQFSYLIFMGGHAATRLLSATAAPRWLAWSLPSFWFLAPFEVWIEGWSWGAIARTLLAAGTLALLLAGGVRFLGAHVGERLLAPVERPRSRSRRSARRRGRRRLTALFPGEENRRLFELLLIHLRSDWRTRSEFLTMPVVALFLIFQFSFSSGAPAIGPTVSIGFLGWFLVLSLDVLTRSSRPSSLWCILVSPVDRVRLSLATVMLVRLLQLVPIALLLLGVELARAGPSLPAFLTAIEFYFFGDLLILMGRGLFPDFPFSRPSRMEGVAGGRRTLVAFSGALVSGVVVLLLWLARQGGISGEGIAILLLMLLRVPASSWMRRRVTQATETLELATGSGD